ncbi:MAG: phage holin family protein [Patescibacteria group bacterium]
MKEQVLRFVLRWLCSTAAIWAADTLLDGVTIDPGVMPIVLSGFLIAAINAVVKPFVMIASIPFVLVSVGLFMLFVNGLMVYLADLLYSGLSIDGYLIAILAGLVIGLVNYMLTIVLEGKSKR